MSEVIQGFTQNHFGFYLDEKPFYPTISISSDACTDQSNVCRIYLDLSFHSDLNFEKQKQIAEKIVSKGMHILWDIDFKLLQTKVNLHFEGHFNSLSRAMTAFLETVLEPFKEHTFGVCLFSGSLVDIDHLFFDEGFNSYFKEWKKEDLNLADPISEEYEKHLLRLYKTAILSEYLHKFSARLYDLAIPFVEIETSLEQNSAKLYQILSRFEPIKLILSGQKIPVADISSDPSQKAFGYFGDQALTNQNHLKPTIGLSFPSDEMCQEESLNELNNIIQKLNEKKIPYRIFPESEGMHYWDQLEKIIVISKCLSPLGTRILQGFCAAMGEVVYVGDALNMPSEISFKRMLDQL